MADQLKEEKGYEQRFYIAADLSAGSSCPGNCGVDAQKMALKVP